MYTLYGGYSTYRLINLCIIVYDSYKAMKKNFLDLDDSIKEKLHALGIKPIHELTRFQLKIENERVNDRLQHGSRQVTILIAMYI